jgi:hypothetical protein
MTNGLNELVNALMKIRILTVEDVCKLSTIITEADFVADE